MEEDAEKVAGANKTVHSSNEVTFRLRVGPLQLEQVVYRGDFRSRCC